MRAEIDVRPGMGLLIAKVIGQLYAPLLLS